MPKPSRGPSDGNHSAPGSPIVCSSDLDLLSLAAARLRAAMGVVPPADAMLAPEGARLVAFAWQPHPVVEPPAPGTAGTAHLLGAGALPDDSIALYDAHEQRWSAHRLANTQQKRLAALAWQPQSSSILAAACAKGICVWRLAHSGDGCAGPPQPAPLRSTSCASLSDPSHVAP